MSTRERQPPGGDRADEQALEVRLSRFALVLSGDERTARRLVERLDLDGRPRDPGFTVEAWQYRQFRRLYDYWRAEPKTPANRSAGPFSPGGEDDAIRKGLNPSLALLLGALPSQHRALLLLVYGENYSYAASARLLDMEIEPLMQALAAARLKFAGEADTAQTLADETVSDAPQDAQKDVA